MNHFFKPSLAALGLLCAVSGAGCNQNSGGGTSSIIGAPSGNSNDTLATVGTSKVTRADLNAFLEAQGGETALPILIDTQLIFEALKAKSLEVSDAEVDADLARRQATDPQLATQIQAGGARIPLFKTQIKRELAIQKLLTAGLAPTDAQVKSFFEKNRRYYDQPSKVTVGMLLASTKTRANLMAEQLKKKTKTLAELVAEQKKAADPLGAQSLEDASQSQIWPQISPTVLPTLEKIPQGGVAPVRQFAPQAFGVFVVAKKTAPIKADLAKIRAEVESDYKNAEVAKKTAAKNPQNPPFDETLRRTSEALKQQNPNATLRDTLNYINQVTANDLITSLRTGGTVQVEDAAYAKVAEPYQPKTPVGGATGNTVSGNTASGNTASGNTATDNAAPAASNAASAAGNAASNGAPARP